MTNNNTNGHNDTIQCHDRIDLLNMIDQLEQDGYEFTVDNFTITVIGGRLFAIREIAQ